MKKYLFTLLSLVTLASINAQSLTGSVQDNATWKPLPNVNITVLGAEIGTVSDPYGDFDLELDAGTYMVQFSLIGFKPVTKEFVVDEDLDVGVIVMETTILEFDAVEVQGIFSTRLGYESVDVVEGADFQQIQTQSVADALRNIPGVEVQFAYPNGRNVNVSIRGSSDYKPGGYNNRVLVLLDGFPVQIPNSGTPDWSALPLENVVRVEVDNNPASAQYGHNSMGGVINLITQQGAGQNIDAVKLSGGTLETMGVGFSYHNGAGSWNYGAAGNLSQSAGHRFNADDLTSRMNTFLCFSDNWGRIYRLNVLFALSDVGHPGFDVLPSYRRSQRNSNYIQGHIFYPVSKGMSLSHSLFLNHYGTRYYDRDDTPEDKVDLEQRYQDVSAGIRSELLLTKWNRWILMMGGELGVDRSQVTVFNAMYSHPRQTTLGCFIQSKYSIGYGWTLGTGLRYDYRLVQPGNGFKSRLFQRLTPKVNLMYALQGERIFTLAYSTGFRAPSLSELYLQYASSYGLVLQGNPEVGPESVRAWELKYEHPYGKSIYWSVALFHNHYQNMIDFVYSLPVLAINREGVTGQGAELQLFWKPFELFSLNTHYALLDMTDRGSDPILYRSKHSGKILLTFEQGTNVFTISLRAWSKQEYEDFLPRHEYEMIGDKIVFPIKELPGQVIADFNIQKELGTYKGIITVSNLLDQKYALIQNFPMPGITWLITITKTL